MPLTITTKYIGPSNTRGSRITATIAPMNDGKNVRRVVPYDHAKTLRRNHEHAAHCLAVFLGLDVGQWAVGELDNGYVFVPYIGEVVELGKGRQAMTDTGTLPRDDYSATGAYLKLPGKHSSFGRNRGTGMALLRLPTYSTLRSTAREVRRVSKLNGHTLTRGTIEYAYELNLDELNPKDD